MNINIDNIHSCTNNMYILIMNFIKMEKVSYTSLRKNLSSVLDKIENNQEPCRITRKTHEDIVMLPRSDYESLKETLYLLSSSKNATKLEESIGQDLKGEYEKVDIEYWKNEILK